MDAWEKCINSFRVELDCDIYITGSNARLLSGELATYLAGRYVEFVVYPLLLCGNLSSCTTTVCPNTDNRQCFSRYLTAGGMALPVQPLAMTKTASPTVFAGPVQLRGTQTISSNETTSGMWICWNESLPIVTSQHWHHIFLHGHFQVSEKRGTICIAGDSTELHQGLY